MKKEFLNPPELPDWHQAFTQIITVEQGASKTIYIAGQVGVDEKQNLVGDGLGAQAAQAFENLRKALAAAGATPADVVKVNFYIKDYKAAHAKIILAIYRTFFPFENLPVSSWLGVQTLAREEFLFEVDAIAVIPQE
jgi:enamine deaminase RidA (YjgF/YER057c/UK114 family)